MIMEPESHDQMGYQQHYWKKTKSVNRHFHLKEFIRLVAVPKVGNMAQLARWLPHQLLGLPYRKDQGKGLSVEHRLAYTKRQ